MASDPADTSPGAGQPDGLTSPADATPAAPAPTPGGGIKWNTDDAADSLLSDLMSDVDEEAARERDRLAAERRARDEADAAAAAEDARQRESEIEEKLQAERERQAKAEEERRRLLIEAERRRAIESGEFAEGEVTMDEAGITVEGDEAKAASEPEALVAPAPLAQVLVQAPPPAAKANWSVTIGLAVVLLLVAAALAGLLMKANEKGEAASSALAKSKSEVAGFEQQLAAATKKADDMDRRYKKLQARLDKFIEDQKKAAAAPPPEAVTAKAAPARRTRRGGARKAMPARKSPKKRKKGLDLGDSLFGGDDGKIVY